MTQNAVGARHWYLYDEADRKVAEVSALGGLVEYIYDKSNQLTQTIAYTNAVSAANIASLVDGAGTRRR